MARFHVGCKVLSNGLADDDKLEAAPGAWRTGFGELSGELADSTGLDGAW